MYQNENIKKSLIWKLIFIHILDDTAIQNGFLSTGWYLTLFFKNFYCYILLKFEKECGKCT